MLAMPMIVCSQPRVSYNRTEFIKLSIGPTVGGIAAFVVSDSEGMVKFGYSVGGKMHIRPIRPVSLTTGFIYNKIFDTSEFYNVQLVLNYFTKDDYRFSAGPLFLFDAYGDRFDIANPYIGFAIGAASQSTGLTFYFIPPKLIFDEGFEDTNLFLGIMITFEISIGIL